jgi:hypothetical protein
VENERCGSKDKEQAPDHAGEPHGEEKSEGGPSWVPRTRAGIRASIVRYPYRSPNGRGKGHAKAPHRNRGDQGQDERPQPCQAVEQHRVPDLAPPDAQAHLPCCDVCPGKNQGSKKKEAERKGHGGVVYARRALRPCHRKDRDAHGSRNQQKKRQITICHPDFGFSRHS